MQEQMGHAHNEEDCLSLVSPSAPGEEEEVSYPTKRKKVCTLCVVSYDFMSISVTTLYFQIIL